MSIVQAMTGNFNADLTAVLPRLRSYALSLTRDHHRANDLVQSTVVKALAGRHSFREGTNLPAWLFRIQRNEFISGLRRVRPTVRFEDSVAHELSCRPSQENGLVMREFVRAFGRLASCQREALLLSVLEGWSYERIAVLSGVSLGTVKSRVSRGRAALKRILAGDEPAAVEAERTGDDLRAVGQIDLPALVASVQPPLLQALPR